MKKYIILVMVIGIFLLTGCNSKTETKLKEITGKIVEASLNDEENIVINKEDIDSELTYIDYKYQDVTIGLIAIKDSNGTVRVVINTCQSCGGSPYAYFVQDGDKIQCQNCGNTFSIDNLGALVEGGCNPIPVSDLKETDEEIIVGVEQLKNLKNKFENWKGPTI